MTKKQAQIVLGYLATKIDAYESALYYWDKELNKPDNTEAREKYCAETCKLFKFVYDELRSDYANLKIVHGIAFGLNDILKP